MCLLDKEMQRQPELRLTLLRINTKNEFLQFVKNPAPSLKPIPVKRTVAVEVSITVMNMRPMPNRITSNNNQVKKLNKDIHQDDKISLGLFVGSGLDNNIVCLI